MANHYALLHTGTLSIDTCGFSVHLIFGHICIAAGQELFRTRCFLDYLEDPVCFLAVAVSAVRLWSPFCPGPQLILLVQDTILSDKVSVAHMGENLDSTIGVLCQTMEVN